VAILPVPMANMESWQEKVTANSLYKISGFVTFTNRSSGLMSDTSPVVITSGYSGTVPRYEVFYETEKFEAFNSISGNVTNISRYVQIQVLHIYLHIYVYCTKEFDVLRA
jgi:hypothetical protein